MVTIYSRQGCHLCEEAIEILTQMQPELKFELEIIYIDGDETLEKLYGEQVPVTHIGGEHHDFWRVDAERFRSSLEKHRQSQ